MSQSNLVLRDITVATSNCMSEGLVAHVLDRFESFEPIWISGFYRRWRWFGGGISYGCVHNS
ncbi:hypothetical protein PR003_g6231 [Phytophthora rubi]|uniref:Uncharacterized protein n=1 Tax=Phytophthora rubi TaxID=129364 RepID=A0A6A4FHC9_9STRA|nr:hypothetical protein PR002_g4129 [Phytophthora rubi]KAE9043100.1 hypothetical protein PR001_g5932 [Phytophthora rubi]KAE9348773.1 hypothetical protein PR003_g6231 [Phytophthora rubi]